MTVDSTQEDMQIVDPTPMELGVPGYVQEIKADGEWFNHDAENDRFIQLGDGLGSVAVRKSNETFSLEQRTGNMVTNSRIAEGFQARFFRPSSLGLDIGFVRIANKTEDGVDVFNVRPTIDRYNNIASEIYRRKPEDGYPKFVEATEDELRFDVNIPGADIEEIVLFTDDAFVSHLSKGEIINTPSKYHEVEAHDNSDHMNGKMSTDLETFQGGFVAAAAKVDAMKDGKAKAKAQEKITVAYDVSTELMNSLESAIVEGAPIDSIEVELAKALKPVYRVLGNGRMESSKQSKQAAQRQLDEYKRVMQISDQRLEAFKNAS